MSVNTLSDLLSSAFRTFAANLHTTTIAKVTAVNAKTIDVQPVFNRVVDGESIELPVFAEVPPIFLGGGGKYTTYPIEVDDYCLLIFTERCFDGWYSGSDFKKPIDSRMHDYSDALALVGLNPESAMASIPSGKMILGSPTASDFVALASLVKAELDSMRTFINSHVHTGVTTGSGSTGTILPAAAMPPINDVGSTVVGAE